MKRVPVVEEPVLISAGPVRLNGDLSIPENTRGLVLFAHGSGSSRISPRNRFVAQTLQKQAIATLLMDLLTAEEEREDLQTAQLRFDIPLLARRLSDATDWVSRQPAIATLPIGYFGASTGAAAALIAAAHRPGQIGAVVSRGGRPDLAGRALESVQAPTLLIVGGDDAEVLELNRQAFDQLTCPKQLQIVPGATHLFEEPGTLDQAARHAAEWFAHYLKK